MGFDVATMITVVEADLYVGEEIRSRRFPPADRGHRFVVPSL